ncbi:LuxR family transcriptional regulator, partial [Escherichia coli]|nr:LuxR family transcriptional regulator [Escherichia coli]EEW8189695.1 LuxR family transcriptional regulator [Escherichia coli]
MVLITTTKNIYLIKALENVFFAAFSDVCVIS